MLGRTTKKSRFSSGFTLVEMMVVSPIVILLIGSFVALIVNLTGEVLSSRGSNLLTYDVQNALNRIEGDVKLSTTYLAATNIDFTSTRQGYTTDPVTGSTTKFTNINSTSSGGSNASIILNTLVTNGNPLSEQTGLVYLANKPNTCNDTAGVDNYNEYSKNTPMTMNVVYYIDDSQTLWRRTIMPSNYADPSVRCGTKPWQTPSCNASNANFCVSKDEKLITGVAPSDFSFAYYPTASSTVANITATNTFLPDASRNSALYSTPTLKVSITAKQTIAGRDISRTGSVSITRLDSNASAIARVVPVTASPAAPTVSATVTEGHKANFTWPRVAGALTYDVDYRINPIPSTPWTSAKVGLTNNERSYTYPDAAHTDVVEVRVVARNSFIPAANNYGTESITIPLWAPLLLKGNWTDHSTGYNTAAYTRTKAGLVMFKGLVKNPSSPAVGDIIGSIPADYRPTGQLIFGTATSGNLAARIDVKPTVDGADVTFGTDSDGGYVSLESIRYIPASSSLTRTPATLLNSWVNFGEPYSGASYVQDSTGRITIEGLIKGGTNTITTPIFNFPSGQASFRPSNDQFYATRSTTFAHLRLVAGSGLQSRGDGTNSFMSINTSYMPSSYTTWTNLPMKNSWIYFGTPYQTPQFTKTTDGVVHLRGLVKSGTASTIGTLPAGNTPKARAIFSTANNSLFTRLDITAGGDIIYYGSSSAWVSLDGISFIAEN